MALPEGRHYELVTPAYKGGYGIDALRSVAVEGESEGDRLVFSSQGVFNGAPGNLPFSDYLAQRGSRAWATSPLVVPATVLPNGGEPSEFSAALSSTIFEAGWPAANTGRSEALSPEPEFLYHDLHLPDTALNESEPGPNFQVFGLALKRKDGKRLAKVSTLAGSANMCHLLVRTAVGSTEPEPIVANAIGTQSDLYELVSGAPGCGGPALRLVGVSNSIDTANGEPESMSSYCPVELGGNRLAHEGNQFNAISSDGSEIFFTTNVIKENQNCDGAEGASFPANPAILFVRLGGERTLEVSKPLAANCTEGPCLTAKAQRSEFVGASEDGKRAFFTTAESLVNGDVDNGKDLYMAEIGCESSRPMCTVAERQVISLTQVSRDFNPGEGAEVQGVVDVAPDGERVYFVAHGQLGSQGPIAEGVQSGPVADADNLYVYDVADGTTRFIADLCSGASRSGEVADSRCPSDLEANGFKNDTRLWRQNAEAQTAGGNGELLVFTTYAQLVQGGAREADIDSARDVYRYDGLDGKLDRVSMGNSGYDPNGNDDGFNAQIPTLDQNGQVQKNLEMSYRAVSEDGSRIVFETADPLSSGAENQLVNAYEWHKETGWSEGRVSLVSSGSDEEPVEEVMITPSGSDIFFVTVNGLLPQDTDGLRDIYDARRGDGFPSVPAERGECNGDGCQGSLTNPSPMLVPGSAVQLPEGAKATATPKKHSAAKKKRRKRKRGHRSRHASRSGRPRS